MVSSWPSSAAQPIHYQHQGTQFSSQYSRGIHHRGMEHPQLASYSSYSSGFCGSYPSVHAEQTLQYQDELNELMMGNALGSDPQATISPSATHPPYQWTGETPYDDVFSPSFDSSAMVSSPEYDVSHFGSYSHSDIAASHGPTSPETLWESQQSGPRNRSDSESMMRVHGLLLPPGPFESDLTTSQQSNGIQGFANHQPNSLHIPRSICPSQTVPSSSSTLYGLNPVWAVEQDHGSPDYTGGLSSPPDGTASFHTSSWPLDEARSQLSLRAEQDRLIVAGKRQNMSYKEIKEQFNIEGAVSTLRGRYRAATKPKSQRVRKPEWKPKDVS
jgi:hypothetical protein